ncbi:RodZ family helix-turn-helix domain-containing protein [Pseudomonas sp. AA-38]|uniref:helix-turn-helix domain-containing protein n=1 Tax=Pseudomonas sp. AA-38 TaxID=3028807 RepID=UPI0023F6A653|nr:RodZ family helix-turn-helix domain-containing protein [Pseudomonas sp. AA-38]
MNTAHTEISKPVASNPGETLRQAREARGWNVAEVAAQLNLTAQRLTQIETGDFDKLPGTTFARGYIRAYAKLLELDQNRLVLEFDQYTGTDATGSEVHALGRIEEPVRYSQSILRLVSFLLLLGLIGTGFFWWQEQGSDTARRLLDPGIEHVEVEAADGSTQIHSLAEPEDQAVAEAMEQPSMPLLLPEDAGAEPEPGAPNAEPSTPAEATAPAAQGAASAPAPAPAQNAAPAPAPQAEPSPSVAAAPGQGLLKIQFSADCWTQVTDADGKILVSALKRGGDSLDVTGKAPLELRLGFARGAQVIFNGETVNVTPHMSGETARLKLGL